MQNVWHMKDVVDWLYESWKEEVRGLYELFRDSKNMKYPNTLSSELT